MPLDEVALRRPGFDEQRSSPVTLPGGGTWYLPKPVIRLRPIFQNGHRIEEAKFCADDAEFDRLKEAVSATTKDEEADFGGAVIDLTTYMLLKNYDLTDDQLGEVFSVELNSKLDATWMTEVMAIAHGRAPKPSAVG